MMDIYERWGNDAYIWKEGTWMPLKEGYCKEYDLHVKEDMLFGKIGEKFTQELFEGNHKIEVKTEKSEYWGQPKKWTSTGNIAIEIRCNGKPSGISATKSSVWIHLLSVNGVIKGGFIFKVDLLKAKIKKLHKDGSLKIVMGGDYNASQMALLPIKELWQQS